MKSVLGWTLLAASALVAGGCARTDAADAPAVVTVVATDYAFDAPASIAAGPTTFRMINRGLELHHLYVVRLEGGKTLDDLLAAMRAGGPYPAWAVDMGGPSAAAPGGEIAATIEMEAGRYALLCVIPSPDGIPHVMKGMSRELTVTPAKGSARIEPAEVTVELNDYGFVFSRPLGRGRQTIRVTNAAAQSHEIVVFRLEEGRTIPELLSWIEKPNGPPPGIPIGGVAGLARGKSNDVTLTFQPGRYALICFLPDAGDGKPHFVHGMMQEITIP